MGAGQSRLSSRCHGRRPRRAPAACAVLLALALLVPAGATARPLITGVSGVYSGDPIAMQRVKRAGASFVQVAVDWNVVAPAGKPDQWHPADPADPNYDWTRADLEVSEAVRAGLTPMLLVNSAPRWAQRCRVADSVGTGLCNPEPAALKAFATAAALRYSGTFQGLPRVHFWQGLNEPNLSLFFSPQFEHGRAVSPILYRKLINSFYSGVKSVNRSNIVLAAGLGPIAIPGFTVGPMRFTRALLCMRGRGHPRPAGRDCKGGVHFDIFDVHPYTTGGPTHRAGIDDVAIGDLGKLRNLLDAADRAGRIRGMFRRTPLWITEFSWDSNPPDPGGLSMSIAARWAARAMYQAWKAGVSHFFWFSLRDDPRGSGSFSESVQSGLYLRGTTLAEDRPKKVLYAFRFPFVAFPTDRGLFFWGRTPSSTAGEVTIQVRGHGGWRRVAVVRANASGIFQGRVRTGYGRFGTGFAKARYRGAGTVPFSMREVKDFHQPPFG